MANGKTSIARDFRYVDIEKTNISINVNNNTTIDLTNDVSTNTPANYEFDHLEFLGAWPRSTWTNAIVSRVYAHDLDKRILRLVTKGTQGYNVKVRIWYRG